MNMHLSANASSLSSAGSLGRLLRVALLAGVASVAGNRMDASTPVDEVDTSAPTGRAAGLLRWGRFAEGGSLQEGSPTRGEASPRAEAPASIAVAGRGRGRQEHHGRAASNTSASGTAVGRIVLGRQSAPLALLAAATNSHKWHSPRHGRAGWPMRPPKAALSSGEMLMAIGGGIGSMWELAGNTVLDRDIVLRAHYQDKALLFLLAMIYFVTLGLAASIQYRRSFNDSSIRYYAHHQEYRLVAEGEDVPSFLETFNQPPPSVSLQVAGYLANSLESTPNIAFSFALDLSPWIVQEASHGVSSVGGSATSDGGATDHSFQRAAGPGSRSGASSSGSSGSSADGIGQEDLSQLRDFLERGDNDLTTVRMCKEVVWPGWEELATNIKHQIRQRGFDGIIQVSRSSVDCLTIYKNKPWANFMHSNNTEFLCALSIFGYLLYLPYIWLRCKQISILCKYRVDIDIVSYWPLLADRLQADGFRGEDGGSGAESPPASVEDPT